MKDSVINKRLFFFYCYVLIVLLLPQISYSFSNNSNASLENLLTLYKDYFIALDYFSDKAINFHTHQTKDYIETYISGNYLRKKLNGIEKEIKKHIYNNPITSLDTFLNILKNEPENELQNVYIFKELIRYNINWYKSVAKSSKKLDPNASQKIKDLENVLIKHSNVDVKIEHKISDKILTELNTFFSNASVDNLQIDQGTIQNKDNQNKDHSKVQTGINMKSNNNHLSYLQQTLNDIKSNELILTSDRNNGNKKIKLQKIISFNFSGDESIKLKTELVYDYNPDYFLFIFTSRGSNLVNVLTSNDKTKLSKLEKINLDFFVQDLKTDYDKIYILDNKSKSVRILSISNFHSEKIINLPKDYSYEKILYVDKEILYLQTNDRILIIVDILKAKTQYKKLPENFDFIAATCSELVKLHYSRDILSHLEIRDFNENISKFKINIYNENLKKVKSFYKFGSKLFFLADKVTNNAILYIYDMQYNQIVGKYEIINVYNFDILDYKFVTMQSDIRLYVLGITQTEAVVYYTDL